VRLDQVQHRLKARSGARLHDRTHSRLLATAVV
jgi:hypothetical protein